MDPLTRITLNQHVILTLPSNQLKIVQLKMDSSISLGKFGAFNVNDILGYPFGTKFEIYYDEETTTTIPDSGKNKNKVPVGKVRLVDTTNTINHDLNDFKSSENNRELINAGNVTQKLSIEDIEAMKKQSASSSEIISKIIESHGSFDKKTVHSQEKYLKRKQKKFNKDFVVNYLSASQLLQFLVEKGDMQRILDMSEESIGMMLNLANIRANGTYLCIDETGGLLVYFMLERMFGGNSDTKETGKIIVLHENEHANLDLLKFSNYSEQFIKDHIVTISLLDYFEPMSREEIDASFQPLTKEEVFELKGGKKNSYYRKLKWYKTQLETLAYTTSFSYDGLVVATTLHLPTLVPKLSTQVHGSRPIVCFSQFKETLLELSHTLYDDLSFLAPSILETRCRPYQTIRGKLHPLMTMRGGGGYLLWCHKVIPSEVPEEEEEEEEQNKEEENTEATTKKQKVE